MQDGEVSQKLKVQLHTVLWNQATLHFQSKEYAPAQELYKAAMHFAADGSLRAKAARTLAICALALKDYDRYAKTPKHGCTILKFCTLFDTESDTSILYPNELLQPQLDN